MGPGLFGERLYGVRFYGVSLYGGAVQNRTLRRGDLKKQDYTAATRNVLFFLLILVNSHVSFIKMSYKNEKSFKSSKL